MLTMLKNTQSLLQVMSITLLSLQISIKFLIAIKGKLLEIVMIIHICRSTKS